MWDWTLRFICKIGGQSYFCECFRKALDVHYPTALAKLSHYSKDGWPHRFIAALKQSGFKAGICHLCRHVPSDLFYCHPMYGSTVMVHYGPYIVRTAIEECMTERDAENKIRHLLGIPPIGEGWVSEVQLLGTVRDVFSDEKVVHQASPDWLGLQRLDIFVPRLNLAIEYQGRQHYEPVLFFGGEEGLTRTRERDRRKAELCSENGITLVYFRHDEEIDIETVKARLYQALEYRPH